MELFFDPEFESNQFVLNEIESKHCINVLRNRVGETIRVTDGKGHLFVGKISNPHPKHCQITLEDKITFQPQSPQIHIAIAPTKNMDRLEWFLEKTTEIGISEITLLLCQHSERRQIRIDRLEKVIVSAMKQSLKYHLPKLNEPTLFNDFVKSTINGQKFIAHCSDTQRYLLRNQYQKQSDAIILIGPEGDFSNEEITTALNSGFMPVSLGNSRLRTETAGVVACTTFSVINEN
jgi:16S rRNA (uracil1498-N3)-methyltransferase